MFLDQTGASKRPRKVPPRDRLIGKRPRCLPPRVQRLCRAPGAFLHQAEFDLPVGVRVRASHGLRERIHRGIDLVQAAQRLMSGVVVDARLRLQGTRTLQLCEARLRPAGTRFDQAEQTQSVNLIRVLP